MNVKKTKIMVIRRNIDEDWKIDIRVGGKILEQVKQYLYLGHIITEDGRCETEDKFYEYEELAYCKSPKIGD